MNERRELLAAVTLRADKMAAESERIGRVVRRSAKMISEEACHALREALRSTETNAVPDVRRRAILTVTLVEGDKRMVEVRAPEGITGKFPATIGDFVVPQEKSSRDVLVGILNYLQKVIPGGEVAQRNEVVRKIHNG